jgi:tetratricopeptide (TPR) repeat protein
MPRLGEKIKSLKGSVVFHIILIAAVGLLAYSNTFDVPFQWDGIDNIVKTGALRDLNNFLKPSKVLKDSRYIGYFTFALNYKIHGLDVTGYHIFNITIHVLNALLVYLLVLLTFKTPFLDNSSFKSEYIALFTGLLFVSHPVQTEAVTYIFQRFASLTTMFYLGSLVLYVKWRLIKDQPSNSSAAQQLHFSYTALLLYCFALLCAILAMKTKENAFTLPIAIALFEFLFFTGPIKRRTLRVIPFLLTLFIIPLTIVSFDKPAEEILSGIGYSGMSRWEYLFTQFRVVVTYIRLLFLPMNQNIDYDYPIFHSLFNPQVFLSLLFLSSFFGLGIYLLYRSRFRAELRPLAFGLFWFFIALSVESSVIPIPMVINEYRVYLPSAGAFLAITTGAFLLLERLRNKGIKAFAVSSFILIPLVLLYATYARNNVWQSKISLWEDVVKKSPEKARGYKNLATLYISRGISDKAIELLRTALRLELYCKAEMHLPHYILAFAYESKGLLEEAIKQYQVAINFKPDYAEAHYNLGRAYATTGLTDDAIEHFKIVLKLKPNNANTHYNLGIACESNGLIEKAVEHYQTAVKINPEHGKAHNNLGTLYKSKGYIDKAVKHYQIALKLKPDDARVHNNLGNVYDDMGLTDKAIEHYKNALGLKPDFAGAHCNLGISYLRKGHTDKAREEFQSALKINPNFHQARRYLERMSKN